MAYEYKDNEFISRTDNYENESTFDLEMIYYLKYNAYKGLFALKKLFKEYQNEDNIGKCNYYHIYIDLLFEATGQIINRFRGVPEKKNIL